MSTLAFADERGSKDASTLSNPAPADQMRNFASDRPTKGFTPYTIDAGHFQYETDIVNFTRKRSPDMVTRNLTFFDPLLRLGMTNNIDLGVQTGGYQRQSMSDFSSGQNSRVQGTGDVTLLPRFNLLGNDGGKVAFALLPYLRLPAARKELGDGGVESGLTAPLLLKLPEGFVLTVVTEGDALRNPTTGRRYGNLVNIVSLEHTAPFDKKMTFDVEFYSSMGTDRMTPPVRTFDIAIEYLITKNLQIDVGANFPLNKYAPRLQVYTGIAQRF